MNNHSQLLKNKSLMDKLGTMVNYLNGKLAWIKSTDLAKELIKYNQIGMTLNQVAQIQAGLQYKPQVQRVPGKWTDANFNDVKHAMDTKRLAQDPALKYQFLRFRPTTKYFY